MTPLKSAIKFRITNSHLLALNSTIHLKASQIGSLTCGKKQLTDEQADIFSKTLMFPKSFFFKKFSINILTNVSKNLKDRYFSIDKTEIEYLEAVANLCCNTIYQYINDKYIIPSFSQNDFNIKFFDDCEFDDCEKTQNNIYYSQKNNLITKHLSLKFLEKFNIKDKMIENVIAFLESKGILVFSYPEYSWRSQVKSFHIFISHNNIERPIIFLRNNIKKTDVRECLFSELFHIILSVSSNYSITADYNLGKSFAKECLIPSSIHSVIKNLNISIYENVCNLMNILSISSELILSKKLDLSNYTFDLKKDFYKITSNINKYFFNVFLNETTKKANINDRSILLDKINSLITEEGLNIDYISNVISIPKDVINAFCFNMFSEQNTNILKLIVS